jgi:hypothetical protein
MANDDVANARGGLLPVNFPTGNYKRNYYRLTTSASAVYIGQPMDLDSNGQVVPALAGSDNAAKTSGKCILGPVVSFARDANGKAALPDVLLTLTASAGLPGMTNCYVGICDDPNQEFVIQEASTTTQLNTSNIGNIVGFSYLRSTSGANLTGYSYAEIDPATATTAAGSGSLLLQGLTDNFNSDGTYNALGAYAKWRVRIANHRLGGNQANPV